MSSLFVPFSQTGSFQFSNPCRPAGGDPRASSPTGGFPKERAVACASTAATGSCGLCCTDCGPTGGDVYRWFRPTRSSVGTAELSPWHWTRESHRLPGRPEVAANIRDLIRRMRHANPWWGAPRIHGELLKLGIEVAQSTVAKYLGRQWKPPSQPWRTFLTNHLAQTAAVDFFPGPVRLRCALAWMANCYFACNSLGFPVLLRILRCAICWFFSSISRLSLPKTPSDLKMQRLRSFVQSWSLP